MSIHRLAIALAATALLATACSGGASDAAPTSSTATSSSTSATAKTSSPVSASPTSASPTSVPGDPNVPPAARAHTKAGAEAFVTNYVNLINTLGVHPRVHALAPLSLKECKTCHNFDESFTYIKQRGEHLSGPVFTRPALSTESSAGSILVTASMRQLKTTLSHSSGTSTSASRAEAVTFEFRLRWIHGGWKATRIYDATPGD